MAFGDYLVFGKDRTRTYDMETKQTIVIETLEFLKSTADRYSEEAYKCSWAQSKKRAEFLIEEKRFRASYKRLFKKAKKLFKDNPEVLKQNVPEWAKELVK